MKARHTFRVVLGLALVLAAGTSAAQQAPATDAKALAAEILLMEAQLQVSCEEVQGLMEDLIRLGQEAPVRERYRAGVFKEAMEKYVALVGDFVVVTREKGSIPPGKFQKEFDDLKERARKAGILAEGPRPDVNLIKLAASPQGAKYFYSSVGSGADWQKKQAERDTLRVTLEPEYEELLKRWREARAAFYKDFDRGEFREPNDTLEQETRLAERRAKESREKRARLTELALSNGGRGYEHCIGSMKAVSYQVVGEGGIVLYKEGEPQTPGSLPGMGFRLVEPVKYPPFKRPNILPEFPLKLYLKLNGDTAIRIGAEINEIKKKTYDAMMLAAAQEVSKQFQLFGARVGGLGPIELREPGTGELAVGYGAYKVTEAAAFLLKLGQYVVEHPIDSGAKALTFLQGVGKATPHPLTETEAEQAERRAQVWAAILKGWRELGDIGVAIAQQGDIKPYGQQPGETPLEYYVRTGGEVGVQEKVNQGLEVFANLGALGLSLEVEAIRAGAATSVALKAASETAKLEATATKSVTELKAIAEEAKYARRPLPAGFADDVGKAAAASEKEVKQLGQESFGKSQALQKFIAGDKELPKVANPGTFKTPEQSFAKGGVNEVFDDVDNPAFVIRKASQRDKNTLDSILAHDKLGRDVVENLKSPNIRVAKQEGFIVKQEGGQWVRHERVERVPMDAKKQISDQGGRMTKGQQLALEAAQADLNKTGYFWMDNTPANYHFEKLPGQDRWRVVVIDSAGIYPAKNPELAKKLQAVVYNLSEEIATGKRPLGAAHEMPMQVLFGLMQHAEKVGIGNLNAAINFAEIQKLAGLKDVSDISRLQWAPGVQRLRATDPEITALTSSYDDLRKAVEGRVVDDPTFKKLSKEYANLQDQLKKKGIDLQERTKEATAKLDEAMKPPASPTGPSGLSGLGDEILEVTDVTEESAQALQCANLSDSFWNNTLPNDLVKAFEKCAKDVLKK